MTEGEEIEAAKGRHPSRHEGGMMKFPWPPQPAEDTPTVAYVERQKAPRIYLNDHAHIFGPEGAGSDFNKIGAVEFVAWEDNILVRTSEPAKNQGWWCSCPLERSDRGVISIHRPTPECPISRPEEGPPSASIPAP